MIEADKGIQNNNRISTNFKSRRFKADISVKQDFSGKVIRSVGYALISLFSIVCLIPFIMMLAASFSSEKAIVRYGYSLLPQQPTIFAYKLVFENPDVVIGSYVVTILLTVIGTACGLFVTAMTGYALQRPDFKHRNVISLFFYFTTLFSGGLVPFYLLITRYLHLKNNYLAVLLPLMLSAWNIIMIKNFMKGIPHAVTESAQIDGAGPFKTFVSIILPMSAPALATIGLFIALGYWNEWYNSLLFLDTNVKYRPIQLFLYNLITKADYIMNSAAKSNVPAQDVPLETMKMATAVIATGPIVLAYPFVQRYFIKGITIGSVKG